MSTLIATNVNTSTIKDAGGTSAATISGDIITATNAVRAPGAVLQVQQTLYTDQFSKTSTAEEDITGFTVTITPTAASSKVLIQVHMNVSSGQNCGHSFTLKRGTTAVGIDKDEGSRTRASFAFDGGNADGNRATSISYQFLDSPNTTSATTYKVSVEKYNTSTFRMNRNSSASGASFDDNYASTITATEIGG